MKILIAGCSGFVGSNLSEYLYSKGHQLTLLTRNKKTIKSYIYYTDIITWDELFNIKNDFDVIINLCGYEIAAKRWTAKIKQKILDSRLIPTQKLVDFIGNSDTKLINTSAIGFYTFSKNEQDENNIEADDTDTFSKEITHKWESVVTNSNIKNWCITRFGVVLGDGGFLKKIVPTAKIGLGVTLGNGDNDITFIQIDDLCKAIDFLIHNSSNTAYNLTAFHCTQKQITTEICNFYNKKLRFQMPRFMVKILFGQMGEELLLSSQKINATKILDLGFDFEYKNQENSIYKCLRKK